MILRTLAFLLAAGAVACTACGGSDERTPGAVANRDGTLILTRLDGIFEMAIKTGDIEPLITSTENGTFLLDPAVSPNSSQLAYVVQPPPRVVDSRYDAGSDIWIANRDGTSPRKLYEHDAPNQLVRFPRWLDENTVFAIIQLIEVAPDGVTSAVYTLQRIDVATGVHTEVMRDVLAFDLSPDGTRIVYASLSPSTGEVLESVDIDGAGNPAVLVPVTDDVSPFNSPDYSPSGDKIAFTAADQTLGLPTGQLLVSARPLGVRPDGLPQDAWVIAATGSSPQLVADLKEDIPGLTWGGDDQHLYVLGASALYAIDLENGAVTEIGEGVFHGQVTWTPGR